MKIAKIEAVRLWDHDPNKFHFDLDDQLSDYKLLEFLIGVGWTARTAFWNDSRWLNHHQMQSLVGQLRKLSCDYIDMYLTHFLMSVSII